MRRLPIYGLMAEFANERDLLAAAQQAHDAGYRRMDAYSPLPIAGLAEALGHHHTAVPLLTLLGGLARCVGGYSLQYCIAAVDYPGNVGGRPLNGWPSCVPVTFELTILLGALSTL